ncbi:hypothetical protein RND71_032103 [Anisodus tanguticus]|uniref:Inositol polyphosphate-related phosphatase domain-containing protein n=1 Tax=Anisodus tanguticus TaxID=243964 RepID=A0AAE1RD24_9SOLA|nr:hypothetical protein RND71_032103 [Anisodus tanguticus]
MGDGLGLDEMGFSLGWVGIVLGEMKWVMDDEKNALEGLSEAPPPRRKAHSYSHQLRTNTGTHHKRHHQIRKHSLDDDYMPNNINNSDLYEDSSEDEGFYPYSTNSSDIISSSNITVGASVVGGSDRQDFHLLNQDFSGLGVIPDCLDADQQLPLQEFAASGGGVGMFKVPTRAAVGRFLRTIACTDTQLWAGQECGVRVWNFSDQYEVGLGFNGRAKRGDEDAAPFYESVNTSPAICLIVDSGSKLVWSGHKDGKIRSWRMDQPNSDDSPFKEGLSWQAHRGPVLSMLGNCRDARSRELLKVYNVEGQIENRVDISSVQDQSTEDDLNVKFVSKSKKEKSQGSSFLQRSRNAIMGAADAVRRVATKGAFVEDSKKTEVLVLAADGMIWSGCSSGLLVQWDGNGNRLQDFHHHRCAVLCLCAHGSRIWVGYVSGMVQVLDLDGNLLAGWVAHNGPVIKMAVGNDYVFSLANHGGIRGWNLASPGPIDNILRPELAEKEYSYTSQGNVRVLVGTWNVGQGRASQEALATWLGSTISDVGIIVVGLQEVEMGAGFLAMSAAKETVGLEGSSVGQWWQDAIGKALNEGSTFERVGSRQLAALLIAIWVRKSIRNHVGDLDVGAVACGIGRAIGNKTAQINPDEGKPELGEADLVIFTGDFNYRLFGISYDEARDFVSQRCFDWLREKDQLRAEMKAGKVFQGMREAIIRFPPTYKFERGKPGLGGETYLYEACMEVTESDHKPVRCKFNVEIAHVDRSVRRQLFGKIFQENEKIKSLLDEFRYIPETLVSTSQIVLQNEDTYNLRISSRSKEDKFFFQITCGGQSTIKEDEQASEYRPRASFGFPRWLEVTPAAGIIKPDQAAEILIRHEEFNKLEETVDGIPQSWWCEDTRDKEVILLINITASRSTEARTHKVHVRHSFSANAVHTTSKSGSRRSQGGGSSHHRYALRQAGSGSEMMTDHQSLRGP